ncbi:MAG TPA: translation initiation factor IF-2 [Pseudomonadales bacterium]|nr:translation initiation factor IF-2 [Pseudomonadales bacterium]
MAEVTVKQLAETVGAPIDRLLKQMAEAGLPHSDAEQPVSEEQKQTLLAFLKTSHGDSDSAPKKITLKRKTTSTLRTDRGRGKAVAVEVRKKRTYVKRGAPETGDDSAESELARLKVEEAQLEEERQKAEAERRAEEATRKAEAEKRAEEQEAEAVEAKKRAETEAEEKRRLDEAEKARLEAAAALAAVEAETATSEKRGGAKPSPKRKPAAAADSDDRSRRGPRRTGSDDPIESRARRAGTLSRDRLAQRKRKAQSRGMPRTQGFERPTEFISREVEVPDAITVGELANRMSVKANETIKKLMQMGVMANINQVLDQDTAVLLVEELGHKPRLVASDAIEQEHFETIASFEGEQQSRPPVVTVMGHVDHGKTSLLDHIRKTRVASGEAGGITQHIGAYHVETGRGVVSFLDTPGHAAFTAMRARGAQVTDIVILVVAADDGVMPQTEEAVQHAKAAGVPIVVAVNKMDKEGADPQRVRNELSAKEVVPEDWGGDTQFVNVSALTGDGIDDLLEAVILQAELLELKAVPDAPGQGSVVESRLDRGRGPVATLLVRNGTLKKGDFIVAGEHYGRVRAMLDEAGAQVDSAGPSIPVEILGLSGTPNAGDDFAVVEDERRAKELVDFRRDRTQELRLKSQQVARMDSLFDNLGEGEIPVLNLVLKTDVRGSLEALTSAINEISTDEVKANIVSSGVGGINESDANLASASHAVIVGFNVRADASAKRIIEQEGLDLRYYSVIYELLDHIKAVLSGMLAPELREEIVGVAEVRDVFRSPKFGAVAGCMVVEGTLHRNKKIRVLRDDIVIYQGELESLRRFKDDVAEVRQGFECGIGVKNYNDVREGDKIEVFDVKEVARSL